MAVDVPSTSGSFEISNFAGVMVSRMVARTGLQRRAILLAALGSVFVASTSHFALFALLRSLWCFCWALSVSMTDDAMDPWKSEVN